MNTSRKASREQRRRPLFPGHRPEKGLHCEVTRHGTEVWYYREGHGPRVRIDHPFGSPKFIEEYKAAKWSRRPGEATLTPAGHKAMSRKDPNSLEWLIDRYLASRYFAAENKPNTQAAHRIILRAVARKNGDQPFRALGWFHVKSLRDQIAEHGSNPKNPKPAPAMANRVVQVLGVLFKWAIEEERLLEINPCDGVRKVKYERTTNHPWTDEECDRFEAAFPLGTRERLAYALLGMTGQRSSDVVLMGPQHIDQDGFMRIRQQKTGKWITVKVPPSLAEAITAGPTGEETFIAKQDGGKLGVSAFGAWLRSTCDSIGLPECTPHGLRHAAATRALENGADVDYLTSVFGFTLPVAARYVQTADGRKAAERGADHLERKAAGPRPHLRVVAG